MGGIPLLGDSCERGLFNLKGGGGHVFILFCNSINLSHLNVWSFLFLQSCNCCRKAYTQDKPDFTQESTTDPSVYHKHNIYPLFWFQIQTLLKTLFLCDSFFFYSNTIFIDMFKYKKHITFYAFSRRFYPKRLTVHSGYTYFVSMCIPWEFNPQTLRC